jgi:hypothetical protein
MFIKEKWLKSLIQEKNFVKFVMDKEERMLILVKDVKVSHLVYLYFRVKLFF